MSPQSFVHLHCHSHYSLLDGSSSIERLVGRTVELGMNALAITDHGNLHGALEFYAAAKAAGINPIIGYEAYIAPGSRFHKESGSQKESSYHLTLLARDRTGFANLLQLATKAFLEGFYFKPRIDREILEAHSEGLLCLSGCLSSEFSRALVGTSREQRESLAQAREIAGWFRGVFGDRYFIEVQDNGLELQRQVTAAALDLSREMGIPPVATCDCHYVNREDAEAQDILLCVNTGRFRNDATRMRMDSTEFYLKSPAEMHDSFAGFDRALAAEAVARSQQIADGVSIELDLGKRHFPGFEVPAGRTSSEELRRLCLEGLERRYADVPKRWADEAGVPRLHEQVMERLERELGVIDTLGFSSYFLIVWDFVRYAREQGIPAAARGSGVGSLVAYALYLSHVCPLEYDLLFERFLDVNRREAPDIDIDFCKERRGEVIEYVKRKYGAANVAQIGTFGTLAARAAIRDVGRALGLPIPRVDSIVALVPDQPNITLEQATAPGSQLAAACEADAEVRELVDLAGRIEGLARNVGTHAAAVVIADRPLVEYVPLQRVTGKEEVITQWAMGDVERAGLMKMDFLGLRYLTVVAKTIEIIRSTAAAATGVATAPDPLSLPLDDRPTFDLLCRGETKGIFQLESGGIRDLLQRMKPDHFRDIVAVNALYRPGPLEGGMVDDYVAVKHGRKRAEYRHPVMRDLLEETHGVMVYQEQVMRILEKLGGIELSSAYTCIKAISKKKIETIAAFREQFVAGARAKGLSAAQAEELFGLIEKFAGYGFNKSHSTAYALLAWQTAYLKTHYPVEFMAALLSGDITGRNFKKKDALVEHVEDCRRMGIDVAPPDVNASGADFTVAGGRILFGLSAIKGCGVQTAEAICAERQRGGPYRDLFDFCGRLDPSVVNRTAVESLAKSGALDGLGGHRGALLAGVERALAAGASRLADRRSGQRNLFDDAADGAGQAGVAAAAPSLPDAPPLSDLEMRSNEKEVLGYYVHSHPLAEHRAVLDAICTHGTAGLGDAKAKSEVVIGGLVAAVKLSNVKQPRPGSTHTRYGMFDLEDIEGIVRSICWPEDYARLGDSIRPDAVVVVAGSIDRRTGSEETNLIVNEIVPIGEVWQRPVRTVTLRVVEPLHDCATLDRLAGLVRRHPGTIPLRLVLETADGRRVLLEADRDRVAWSHEFHAAVADLLGPGCVRAAITLGSGGRRRDGEPGRRGPPGRTPAGVG